MAPILEVRDLVKEYPLPRRWRELALAPWRRKRRRALDGLSLSIEAGERVALIGPNGAGKTTLARVLCGVVAADSGTATIGGYEVGRSPHARRRVGMARPEDPALHPRLDARESLRFHLALYDVADSELAQALERVEATPLAGRPVQGLSAGEKAKISLAKAIAHLPELLILDEISRVLDPGAAARMRSVLADFTNAGNAVLLITHDLNEASRCDRVVVLEAGRVRAEGSWADVEPRAKEVFGL